MIDPPIQLIPIRFSHMVFDNLLSWTFWPLFSLSFFWWAGLCSLTQWFWLDWHPDLHLVSRLIDIPLACPHFALLLSLTDLPISGEPRLILQGKPISKFHDFFFNYRKITRGKREFLKTEGVIPPPPSQIITITLTPSDFSENSIFNRSNRHLDFH